MSKKLKPSPWRAEEWRGIIRLIPGPMKAPDSWRVAGFIAWIIVWVIVLGCIMAL